MESTPPPSPTDATPPRTIRIESRPPVSASIVPHSTPDDASLTDGEIFLILNRSPERLSTVTLLQPPLCGLQRPSRSPRIYSAILRVVILYATIQSLPTLFNRHPLSSCSAESSVNCILLLCCAVVIRSQVAVIDHASYAPPVSLCSLRLDVSFRPTLAAASRLC